MEISLFLPPLSFTLKLLAYVYIGHILLIMDLTIKPDPDRKSRRERVDTPVSLQPTMATIHDDDERLLARIGYKQVLAPNAL